MSVRGPGDTGYDHNIPHLHKAFERMSLEERKPEPYQRPPPFIWSNGKSCKNIWTTSL